ncbi:MAG TPA: hypothetical protein VGM39_24315 [Kofleriaceae bacterium]|jgi:hypothetical protein
MKHLAVLLLMRVRPLHNNQDADPGVAIDGIDPLVFPLTANGDTALTRTIAPTGLHAA